jgi:hypothetical protein
MDLANPAWFEDDPELAWGFYGHRLELYRRTVPHRGFEVLRLLAERAGRAFVFTSNVDGQFQRAGFPEDSIVECHGSIHHLQCLGRCGIAIFPADATVAVDPASFRARPPLPAAAWALARPNILCSQTGAGTSRAAVSRSAASSGSWIRHPREHASSSAAPGRPSQPSGGPRSTQPHASAGRW